MSTSHKSHESRWPGALVQQDPPLDSLPADGALAHAVAAQLARAMAAHEDHVLQTIQTHWAHGLEQIKTQWFKVFSSQIPITPVAMVKRRSQAFLGLLLVGYMFRAELGKEHSRVDNHHTLGLWIF